MHGAHVAFLTLASLTCLPGCAASPEEASEQGFSALRVQDVEVDAPDVPCVWTAARQIMDLEVGNFGHKPGRLVVRLEREFGPRELRLHVDALSTSGETRAYAIDQHWVHDKNSYAFKACFVSASQRREHNVALPLRGKSGPPASLLGACSEAIAARIDFLRRVGYLNTSADRWRFEAVSASGSSRVLLAKGEGSFLGFIPDMKADYLVQVDESNPTCAVHGIRRADYERHFED